MTYYAVHQQYYDNGSVNCWIETVEAEQLPENQHQELSTHDFYIDFFTSRRAAQSHLQDCNNA